MNELIQYDDDPSTTAAEQWLNTRLGQSILKNNNDNYVKLLRAFRAGYIIRQMEQLNTLSCAKYNK